MIALGSLQGEFFISVSAVAIAGVSADLMHTSGLFVVALAAVSALTTRVGSFSALRKTIRFPISILVK